MKVFLGMLTFPTSKYMSQAFEAYCLEFQQQCKQSDFSISTQCHVSNNEDVVFQRPLSLYRYFLSTFGYLLIKIMWVVYLNKQSSQWKNLREVAVVLRHHLKFFIKGLNATKRSSNARRLMSITQGHLGLFKEAVMSGADTIVIFEDDSDFSNFTIQAKQLIDVIENSQKSRNSEVFVDVSVSFSWESLGVTHLFDTACNENFMKKGSPSIMRARKPVTNTTSAVLYNKTILISLIPFLEEKTRNRFFQFVPFDHLINLYFVMQKGASKSIDCFHVVPGIFPQLSLSSRR